jgi:hypothetical protein
MRISLEEVFLQVTTEEIPDELPPPDAPDVTPSVEEAPRA